jgi:hypothetical protein
MRPVWGFTLNHWLQERLERFPKMRLQINIREQLSIFVAMISVTAVGILSLVFVCLGAPTQPIPQKSNGMAMQ